MDSLFLAMNVVIPLVVYMAVGAVIRKCRILDEENFKKLNEMLFRVMIPLALFFDVYDSDLRSVFQPKLFIFTGVMLILVYIVAFSVTSRLVHEKSDAATITQGIYRSNYVLFGGTIAASLCGEEGAAVAAALAVVAVPLVNILAVILFETLRGGKVKKGQLLFRIFQNPLVDAGIAGAVLNLLNLQLPDVIEAPLVVLGDIATPLALVTLGGLLSFRSMVSHKKYLFITVLCRLAVVPFFGVLTAILFGFRNEALVALFAVFASPTAVASAPMAQSMGGNGALAGEIVVVSSVCSILSIFLFVMGLAELGFL